MDADINYVYLDYGEEMSPNACYIEGDVPATTSAEDVDGFVSDGVYSDYEYFFTGVEAGDIYVSVEIVRWYWACTCPKGDVLFAVMADRFLGVSERGCDLGLQSTWGTRAQYDNSVGAIPLVSVDSFTPRDKISDG